LNQKDAKIFIGVDEAGRGCLAGPVVSASVAIYEHQIINGVNDSKLLTPKKRDFLYDVIQNECLSSSIKSIDNHVIDEKNILVATLESMKEAIDAIEISADEIVIDGPHKPVMHNHRDLITRGVIGGDKLFHCISAASIIAKVYRDRFMIELHQKFPEYNFQKNKGYPTKDHIQVIKKLGPSPYHRLTFKPELYDEKLL